MWLCVWERLEEALVFDCYVVDDAVVEFVGAVDVVVVEGEGGYDFAVGVGDLEFALEDIVVVDVVEVDFLPVVVDGPVAFVVGLCEDSVAGAFDVAFFEVGGE